MQREQMSEMAATASNGRQRLVIIMVAAVALVPKAEQQVSAVLAGAQMAPMQILRMEIQL